MVSGRNSWFKEQDCFLVNLVETYGPKGWRKLGTLLSEEFPENKKSGKQCRERWKYHLSPDISKEERTEEERQTVFHWHQKVANNWSEIARHLPGRTDISVKNMFYCELKKATAQYNQANKGARRIQRTRKSLIKDKSITKILGLDSSAEQAEHWELWVHWYFMNLVNMCGSS